MSETPKHASGKTDFELVEAAIDVAVNGADLHEDDEECPHDDTCECRDAATVNDGYRALVRMDRDISSLREQVRTLTAERDAAQRTAALERTEARRLRALLDPLTEQVEHERNASDTLRARMAEVEKDLTATQAKFNGAAGACLALGTRATKAESAFATLRQAVEGEAADCCLDATPPVCDRCKRLLAALNATPAEHPDTAALHELQTRLKEALEGANDEDFGFWISTADANELRSLLGDSGPSGGGEKRPMGHPCAGDSSAEVEKSRCPHSDFGDGVCTLPAGHAEPHRLSHDAPEIEDNSDSAFHTRLTASEEATLRMHINRAKAPPNDWSKHAKGCTVEWTPTPSGPTPRVWTCAPDCPSKATTPPDVAASETPRTAEAVAAAINAERMPCIRGVTASVKPDGVVHLTPYALPIVSGTVAASETQPEEDWRTVEEALRHNLSDAEEFSGPRAIGDAKRALAALARLKAAPRRAADAMRERCAKVARDCQCTGDSPGWRAAQAEIEDTIRALPL